MVKNFVKLQIIIIFLYFEKNHQAVKFSQKEHC